MDSSLLELPHDIEAERHVVGSCLLTPSCVTAVMSEVVPGDFFARPYKMVYQAICEMQMTSKPINVNTVVRHLDEMRSEDKTQSALAEMGGAGLVMASIEGVLPEEVTFWCGVVKKKRAQRELIQFAQDAQKMALNDDIDTVRAKLEERLVALSGSNDSEVTTMSEGMEELEARIERYINNPDAITGMPTGWAQFDAETDGSQPGNVTIVYAPSGRFKSFFITNIARALAKRGYPGLWYPTEMPAYQTKERLIQMEAGLNFKWLRKDRTIGHYQLEIKEAIGRAKNLPIYFAEGSLDIGAIGADIARHVKWNKIKWVIVDLVDHVGTSAYKDDGIAQQNQVMKKFKQIAKRCGVHIFLVSHIAKGERSMRNKASLDPEDMKGSSAKYQDVDVAISIMVVEKDPQTGYWRGLTREELSRQQKERKVLKILVSITKNRHGEIVDIPFAISMQKGGRMQPLGNHPSAPVLFLNNNPETEQEAA